MGKKIRRIAQNLKLIGYIQVIAFEILLSKLEGESQ